jgi:hypothetical protein
MFLRLNRQHHHHFRERATVRRLSLERIEDRLLLAGVMQTGMETQIVNFEVAASPLIDIDGGTISPCGTALGGNAVITTPSAIGKVYDIGYLAQPTVDLGIFVNLNATTDGTRLISLRAPDFPTSPNPPQDSPVAKTPAPDPLDIAVVYQTPMLPTADSSLPGSGKASPVVETKPPASQPMENLFPKTGVEGARGKAQIFDLAAAAPVEESKPDAVRASNVAQLSNPTDKPVGAETKFTSVRLASVSLPMREAVSKSDAAAVRYDPGSTSFGQSKLERGQLAGESAQKSAEQTRPHFVPAASAAAATTGQAASKAQAVRVAALPHTRAMPDRDMPAAAETHAQRLESNFTDGQSNSAKPLQSTDTAEAGRRAVFADMAKHDSDPRLLPILLPEHRRVELIGLAVAVVAGQPLVQKWRRRFASGVEDIDDEMLPR